MSTDDILDDLLDDLGVENKAETPEEKLYRELTEGKHPRLFNAQYWLKHELHVYKHLMEKSMYVVKPSGPQRIQVSYKELSRALLEYYFQMTHLPRFSGEDAIRRGVAVSMDKFLDIVMEHPLLKKVIDNPSLLV